VCQFREGLPTGKHKVHKGEINIMDVMERYKQKEDAKGERVRERRAKAKKGCLADSARAINNYLSGFRTQNCVGLAALEKCRREKTKNTQEILGSSTMYFYYRFPILKITICRPW
jgi:hypothetical protein